eukprot:TRINITY_DN14397_c0_g1_i1.p1 TRINITY_DN14397_c0_g1~~TRINITY_DN14397_c0_g1_i1.p1  ORF type:complete len:165 (+),score=12.59 TRINITY_DN14397_c0_g1_i1:86-580(+)
MKSSLVISCLVLFGWTLKCDAQILPDYFTGCQSGWTYFQGHCYRFYPVGISWIKAQEACYRQNSYLATVTSSLLQKFIGNLQRDKHAWIGGSRPVGSNPSVGWKWEDKSEWRYQSWHANEPNGKEERCLLQFNSALGNGWNDATCTNDNSAYNGYVCEKHWTAA